VEPRGPEAYLKQYVEGLSGEPARLHAVDRMQACRSSEFAIAAKVFMNNAGYIPIGVSIRRKPGSEFKPETPGSTNGMVSIAPTTVPCHQKQGWRGSGSVLRRIVLHRLRPLLQIERTNCSNPTGAGSTVRELYDILSIIEREVGKRRAIFLCYSISNPQKLLHAIKRWIYE